MTETQQQRILWCINSGVANPDSQVGCYAMNPNDYEEFKPFFKKVLEKYHKVNLDEKHHVTNWDLSNIKDLPEDKLLDVSKLGLPQLSMRVRTGRNLNKYPLPGSMSKDDRINMENDLQVVFDSLISKPEFGGKYVSLTPGNKHHINDKE